LDELRAIDMRKASFPDERQRALLEHDTAVPSKRIRVVI
jgi:hypothetical protein